MKVINVVGARPNFMKMAPIIEAMNRYPDKIEHLLVHTGQHYDARMSKAFFDDLGMPKPDVDLEVGSGSHAEQTAKVMIAFENLRTEGVAEEKIVFVGNDPERILSAAQIVMNGFWRRGEIPEKWDGRAAERIVEAEEFKCRRMIHIGLLLAGNLYDIHLPNAVQAAVNGDKKAVFWSEKILDNFFEFNDEGKRAFSDNLLATFFFLLAGLYHSRPLHVDQNELQCSSKGGVYNGNKYNRSRKD